VRASISNSVAGGTTTMTYENRITSQLTSTLPDRTRPHAGRQALHYELPWSPDQLGQCNHRPDRFGLW
jgi:hypothetical protein